MPTHGPRGNPHGRATVRRRKAAPRHAVTNPVRKRGQPTSGLRLTRGTNKTTNRHDVPKIQLTPQRNQAPAGVRRGGPTVPRRKAAPSPKKRTTARKKR